MHTSVRFTSFKCLRKNGRSQNLQAAVSQLIRNLGLAFCLFGKHRVLLWFLFWGKCTACLCSWSAPIFQSHTFSVWPSWCQQNQKLHGQPRICTQDLSYQRTVCSIIVLLKLMLPFVHGVSLWLLFLSLFPQVAMKRSNMSSSWTVNSWNFNVFSQQLLVTSSRHIDPCKHGIVVMLHTSCCFPCSVVTKHKDPTAAVYVCFQRDCPMLLFSQNVEVWVEHSPFGVKTFTFWMVRHAARLLSHFQAGASDGTKAYARHFERPHESFVLPFLKWSHVEWSTPKPAKLRSSKGCGLWLGRTQTSNACLIDSKLGIVVACTIRRLPASERDEASLVVAMRSAPVAGRPAGKGAIKQFRELKRQKNSVYSMVLQEKRTQTSESALRRATVRKLAGCSLLQIHTWSRGHESIDDDCSGGRPHNFVQWHQRYFHEHAKGRCGVRRAAWNLHENKDVIWRLKRVLNGLKDASRFLYEHFVDVLTSRLGFSRSETQPTLFRATRSSQYT